MNKYLLQFLLFIMIAFTFSGCGVVEGIFKAGMIWAFLIIFVIIFVIAWIFFKRRK